MSTPISMQSRAKNFLCERRLLGFEMKGYFINSFARYVDAHDHHGPLTTGVMANWARSDKGNSNKPEVWARRLKAIRPFARYLRQFDPLTEIPDDTIFGRVGRRLTPHIYSKQEILDLLEMASRLDPPTGLRGATYETMFGLIASTGLRISEASHLLDSDVDLNDGLLTIRRTKFAKSRQVPLHSSTVDALRSYRQLRNSHVKPTDETSFFIGTRGRSKVYGIGAKEVLRVFIGLRAKMGWTNRGEHRAPRVHDLRHTFIVRRMMLWQEQGTDFDQAMLSLSTYVGHANVTSTYWYLTGVPELMKAATNKYESFIFPQDVHHE